MDLVLPGRELILARFLRSTSVLIREDFPTFDLPAKGTSDPSGGGELLGLEGTLYEGDLHGH